MKKSGIILLLCLTWQAAAAGPRRPWKRALSGTEICFSVPSFHHSKRGLLRRRILPRTALCLPTSTGILYWHAGRFYNWQHGSYYPFIPAPGTFFQALPAHCRIIRFRGSDYFFSYGSCFLEVLGGYRCIAPPTGIRVPDLPFDEIQYGANRGEVLFRDQIWQEVVTSCGRCYELTGFCPG